MRGMANDLSWDFHFAGVETEVRNDRGEVIAPNEDGTITIPERGTYWVRQRSIADDDRYSESFGTIERG
jgi:acyl-coenzyme A synthetase/AMP-(fatty) acid ligase